MVFRPPVSVCATLVFLVGVGAGTAAADTQELAFAAGSLVIPMDECHQYANMTDFSTSRTAPRCYCPSASSDDGVIKAYGLIYRLLENGIIVSVGINDTKTEVSGVDFSITAAEPVKLYNRSTNASTSFFKRGGGITCANASATTPNVKIDYRGAPFIIPAAHAPAALALIKNGSAGINGRGAFTAATFNSVDVHVAQTAFTAKIARTYSGAPKPVALLNLDTGGGLSGGNGGYAVLVNYLTSAGLNTTGAGGSACAPGTIFGTFNANSDFTNNCLITGGYSTLWAPHWEAGSNGQLAQVVAKISAFVDSGKALFAECAAIATFEGAFEAPELRQGDYTVAISTASYASNRKVTVSGTTYPNTTVAIKSARTSSTCTTTLATVTADSAGAYTWTSSAYASATAATAAACRVSIDSQGTTVGKNTTNLTCAPASTTVCPGTTTYNGPSCGSVIVDAAGGGHYMANNGLVRNGVPGGLWGMFSEYGAGSGEGYIYRDPANIYLQKGDLAMVNGYGHTRHWKEAKNPVCVPSSNTNGGTGQSSYKPTTPITRLISTCDGSDFNTSTHTCVRAATDPSTAFADPDSEWDTFIYTPHKDGDEAKGPIIYLGGHDYNGSYAGVRLVLNTVLNLQYEVEPEDPALPVQVVRSSPIIGPIGGVEAYVQGSFIRYSPDEEVTAFDPAHADEFLFPYRTGHVYGYDVSNILTVATAYQDLGAPLFDAATKVPAATASGCAHPFGGSCRTVFTNVATGADPARVMFDTTHRSAFGSLLGGSLSPSAQDTLVTRVLAGRPDSAGIYTPALGGVDRSTLALIESSPQAGVTRPAMIYVGGMDGMLHAICAEQRGDCDEIGRELWAFMPRTQLGRLRQNTQKIQGSPKVADFLANFDGVSGLEWRTVLAFHTGSGTPSDASAAPSLYVLDITDPFDPAVLWEAATPSNRGNGELGVGLDVAIGPVRIGNDVKPTVFVSTNNGGTSGAGVYVNAYSAVDGTPLWSQPWTFTYPDGRQHGGGPPASGIPGGLAAFDQGSTGALNRLAVPTLYGDLWVLDAANGENIYTDEPVFRFTQDKKPIGAAPAIYQTEGGAFFAVIVSGGYIDDDGATWTNGQQYVVAVKLDVPESLVPFNETGQDSSNRPWVVEITGNAFAQPTIAGGEVFVMSASTDINDIDTDNAGDGNLYRINLGNGALDIYEIGSSGAASVDFSSGTAYVSGVVNTMKVELTDHDANGKATELQSAAKAIRRFWISN